MPEPTIIFVALSAAVAAFVVFVPVRMRARRNRLAARVAARERAHLARELHDGLTQELAFISMQARNVAHLGGDEVLDQIADAAERALSESRELISTLRSPSDELSRAITQTAEVLVERHGATLSLDIDPELHADPETGRHLLRILAEALSNSLVHGRAGAVTVRLSGGDSLRLQVTDDGIGFEPGASRHGDHFGLVSMRERARELGGELLLRSRPGAGTEIEVVLP